MDTHTAHSGIKKLTVTAYTTLADFCFTFQIDNSLILLKFYFLHKRLSQCLLFSPKIVCIWGYMLKQVRVGLG